MAVRRKGEVVSDQDIIDTIAEVLPPEVGPSARQQGAEHILTALRERYAIVDRVLFTETAQWVGGAAFSAYSLALAEKLKEADQ